MNNCHPDGTPRPEGRPMPVPLLRGSCLLRPSAGAVPADPIRRLSAGPVPSEPRPTTGAFSVHDGWWRGRRRGCRPAEDGQGRAIDPKDWNSRYSFGSVIPIIRRGNRHTRGRKEFDDRPVSRTEVQRLVRRRLRPGRLDLASRAAMASVWCRALHRSGTLARDVGVLHSAQRSRRRSFDVAG